LTCGNEGIAPVVARPGQHQHAFAAISEHFARKFGHRKSRAQHQRRRRRLRQHRLLDLPYFPDKQDGGNCIAHE